MAGRGPAPKEDPVRRNAPVYETAQVEWDGRQRGPDLPALSQINQWGESAEFEWNPMTLEWWDNLRNSPQAMVMHQSDWDMMLQTAMLHTRFWNGGLKSTESTNLAAEIRRRLADYGATYADRQRLRMVIKTDHEAVVEQQQIDKDAANAVDYAQRLLQAAAERISE